MDLLMVNTSETGAEITHLTILNIILASYRRMWALVLIRRLKIERILQDYVM